MQKLIFINRYFYPDISATSQLLTDLSVELSHHNYDVEVVTGRNLYMGSAEKLPGEGQHSGVNITRIWTTSFGQYGLPGRAIDYLSFYASASFKLLWIARRGDVLIAKTDPPMMSVLVRVVGSLRSAKTINWLQDIFPEVAEQLHLLPRGYGIGTLIRSLRNWSLRYSDANVVLGERMKEKLLTFGVRGHKIHVIPNWSDGNSIRPLEHSNNPLRKEWGLENKFVVAYSGNMGRAHEFETILDAAEKLKSFKNIVFLWIGGGVKKATVQEEAKKRGITNFIFKDHQPKEILSQSLGAGDVHLTVLSPNLEGLIVPSKYYGAAAAGRPILYIGDKEGEIARINKKARSGYNFKTDEGRKLAKFIVYLSRKEGLKEKLGRNARKSFDENFQLAQAINSWRILIEKIQIKRRSQFASWFPLRRPRVPQQY